MRYSPSQEKEHDENDDKWIGVGGKFEYGESPEECELREFIEREGSVTLSFFKDEWKDALKFCGSKSGRDYDKCKAIGLKGVSLDSGAIAFEQASLVLDCRKLFKPPMTAANFIDKSVLERWYNTNP